MNTQKAKENLIRLGMIQNTIQLMKELDRQHGFNTFNKEKLAQLESEADSLYEAITGRAKKLNG